MKKDNYYVKAIYIVLLVIATTMIIIQLVENKVDYYIENIKADVDEFYKCEFHYKDLDYKGICNDDLLSRATEMIEFDLQLKILEQCMVSPYAYRYLICEDMGVNLE